MVVGSRGRAVFIPLSPVGVVVLQRCVLEICVLWEGGRVGSVRVGVGGWEGGSGRVGVGRWDEHKGWT